jgi:hypothetical protein
VERTGSCTIWTTPALSSEMMGEWPFVTPYSPARPCRGGRAREGKGGGGGGFRTRTTTMRASLVEP